MSAIVILNWRRLLQPRMVHVELVCEQRRDRCVGGYPVTHRVSYDPVRVRILNRAGVSLTLRGGMLGHASDPGGVRPNSGQIPAQQGIIDR